MQTTNIKQKRATPEQLAFIKQDLTPMQKEVLLFIDAYTYAYGSQIQRLFFTQGTSTAMIRARNRILTRLVDLTLLYRYSRRPLPGNQHGSTEHIYALDRAGQWVINELLNRNRPYRTIERTTSHFMHRLYATELYVQLKELEPTHLASVLSAYGEPNCHIHKDSVTLKPDALFYLHVTKDNQPYELGWFVEIEHYRHDSSTIQAKINQYRAYRDSLNSFNGFMPRVLFVTFDEGYDNFLTQFFTSHAGEDQHLFVSTLFENATQTMVTNI